MSPINFDQLPSNKPTGNITEKGTYYGTIGKPEMRNPKTPASAGEPPKKPYLNFNLTLQNPDGTAAGKIWDKITESDHELPRYKLQRFITALGIPLVGSFELRDLVKIIDGKQLIVDVTVKTEEGRAPQAEVDVFSNEIYYPISAASEVWGDLANTPFIIDEADAIDAGVTPPETPPTEY